MSSENSFKGTTRFIVNRCLGSGAFGIVYEVFDREREENVALKVLRYQEPQGLYRFKQEFRSLVNINHRNLVTLYDLIFEGENWFLTMELVDGTNIVNYIRGANNTSADELQPATPKSKKIEKPQINAAAAMTLTQPPQNLVASHTINLSRINTVFLQLAEGINALHSTGRIHCDLKPHNILVSREGRVVILDFGLVMQLSNFDFESSFEDSCSFIGTPKYMSPEQGAGLLVTESSDWYSFGVVLYECLTGVIPFSSAGKKNTILALPSTIQPQTPSHLDSLCLELLSKDPNKRPEGKEVIYRLKGINNPAPEANKLETATGRIKPLIGRKIHLKYLIDCFWKVKSGKPVTILVSGKSGFGKTSLIQYFLNQIKLRDDNTVIFIGRCFEQEIVPYKALDNLVDSISNFLNRLSTEQLQNLLPRNIGILAHIFPVLKQLEVISEHTTDPNSGDMIAFRHLMISVLKELINNIARRYPLVIFIDDLQWSDNNSIAALKKLMSPPTPPILLILSSRNDEENIVNFLKLKNKLAVTSSPLHDLSEINLGELDLKESYELISTILNEQQSLPLNLIYTLLRESGGNPFFIEQIAKFLVSTIDDRQIVEYTQAATLNLIDSINFHISTLPENAARLLAVIAVSGQPLQWSIARKAALLDANSHHALTILRVNQLIKSFGKGKLQFIETYHDKIREAMVKSLSEDILKLHHYNLAVTFEEEDAQNAEAISLHYAKAGIVNKARDYCIIAAHQAETAYNFDRAAKFYQLALRYIDDDKDGKRNILEKLGLAQEYAGKGFEAANAYLQAAQLSAGYEALALKQRSATQFLFSGYIDEGLQQFNKILSSFSISAPSHAILALILLMIKRIQLWLRGYRFKPISESEIQEIDRIKLDTLWDVSRGLSMVDTINAAYIQAHHLLLALQVGEPLRIVRGLALEIVHFAAGGSRGRKRVSTLEKLVTALVTKEQDPFTTAVVKLQLGCKHWLQGEWSTGCEYLTESEFIFRKYNKGVCWELDNIQILILYGYYYQGLLTEIYNRLPVFIADAQNRGDLYALTNLKTRILPLVLLCEDNPEQALTEIDEAIGEWTAQRFLAQHYFAMFSKASIHLYQGNLEKAWETVSSSWQPFQKSLLDRAETLYFESLFLRASISCALGGQSDRPRYYLRIAKKAVKSIARRDMVWGNGLANLILANISMILRDREAARNYLTAARKLFEAAEMKIHAAAASYRLGQLMGGNSGQELIAQAESWMEENLIYNKRKFIQIIAPVEWQP